MIFEPTVSDESDSEFILFLSNMAEKDKGYGFLYLDCLFRCTFVDKTFAGTIFDYCFWIFVRLFIYVKYRIWEKRVYKYDGKKKPLKVFLKK